MFPLFQSATTSVLGLKSLIWCVDLISVSALHWTAISDSTSALCNIYLIYNLDSCLPFLCNSTWMNDMCKQASTADLSPYYPLLFDLIACLLFLMRGNSVLCLRPRCHYVSYLFMCHTMTAKACLSVQHWVIALNIVIYLCWRILMACPRSPV